MTKQKVGKQYVDIQKNTDKQKVNVLELAAEMKKEFMPNLFEAVNRGCLKWDGDFWIDIENKQEPLMPKMFRDMFQDKKDCPTPRYDQSLFRYNRQKGQIEHWWTIPDKDSCLHMLLNHKQIPPEEHQLLKWVIQFGNGELFKLSKKLNGEKLDTPEIEKKDIKIAVT
jgi:hypothetical protein